jgi:uncharacterized RDD family membrane protein YckC
MTDKIIPVTIERLNDDIYAGFWPRFASLFIDGIIIKAAFWLVSLLNNYSYVPLLLEVVFTVFYYVYLVQHYGGTPGKRIMNIKIIKLNGEDVSWKEALMRESVNLLVLIIFNAAMIYIISQANQGVFDYYEVIAILEGVSDHWLAYTMIILQTLTVLWVLSELVTLLLNKRKQALHDFLAGTVVVKDIYIDDIREEMSDTQQQSTVNE